MSYLGSNLQTGDPTRTIAQPLDADRFSGNASNTSFTLTRAVAYPTDIEVFVENIQQEPVTAYTVNSTTLTFTEAPPTGTSNIYVVYRQIVGTTQVTLADGSVTYAKLASNIRLFTSDNLTPNGNNSVFTLSEPPADANTVFVTVDGVVQRAPVHYTTSGTTITFSSAPPANSNVHVRHLGFRTSTSVTAIPVGTYIPQPNIASPTITGTISGGPITVDSIGNMGLGVSPNSGWTTSNGRVLELTGNGSLYGYTSGGVYSTMIGSNIYWDGTNWKAKTTGTTGLYQFTGSTFAFYNSPSTTAGATTSLTSVLSNQGANNTVVLQGGASSAGIGIAFPAIQSASSNANTLDDYEEGTYTPTVTPTSGSITSYTSTGYYVKTGKQVTCWFNVKITNVGTGTGTATIASLPFSHNASDQYGIVALGRDTDVTGVVFQGWGSGTSFTVQTVTNGNLMATNTRYVGFVTYTF